MFRKLIYANVFSDSLGFKKLRASIIMSVVHRSSFTSKDFIYAGSNRDKILFTTKESEDLASYFYMKYF